MRNTRWCSDGLEIAAEYRMAEAFVRTLKRDDVRLSPSQTPRACCASWAGSLTETSFIPNRALGYRSPREFIARSTQEALSGL